MDCTADLLLVFVRDETACGTARSNIGNILSFLLSVLLLAVPEAVLSHTKTRSKSAVQSILSLAPRHSRRSLVPYKSEEHQFYQALLTERTVCGMSNIAICYKKVQPSMGPPSSSCRRLLFSQGQKWPFIHSFSFKQNQR